VSTLNDKGKDVPINHHAVKTYGGLQTMFHGFLTSALDRGE
jgi:hypothetical protein